MERSRVAAAAMEWLRYLAEDRRLAISTRRTYRSSLTRFLSELPESYTDHDFQDALDERMGKRVSEHVARATFVTLKAFYEWWEGEGGPLNPLRNMKPPAKPQVRRRPFLAEEVQMLEFRLMAADIKDRCEVLLMIHQGFRVGSVVNLKVSDIDFAGQRLHVRGKAGLSRWMPLGPTVADALTGYLKFAGITEGYVFTGPRGKMSTRAVWKAWRRVAGSELKHLVPHQLRHSFANALLRGAGANVHDVMHLMGHRDLGSTQLYLTEDTDAQRSAILNLPTAMGWKASEGGER